MINNIERYKELKQASYLSLQYRNKSLASQELCNVVVLKLLSVETRRRVRKAKDMQAFKLAIELLLAGLIVAKSTNKYGWTYRELGNDTFIGQPIKVGTFKKVIELLHQADYIEINKGSNHSNPFYVQGNKCKAFQPGLATRFRATKEILSIYLKYGIVEGNYSNHYLRQLPNKVLKKKSSSTKTNGQKASGRPMKIERDAIVFRLEQQVKQINSYLDKQQLEGAIFCGYHRVFNMGDIPLFNWDKGGRLNCPGQDSYQRLKKQQRLKTVTINGEPVVEVDINASYLSIYHGILGRPLPKRDDIYDIPGLHRDIVKAWITAAFGNNKLPIRWPSAAKTKLLDKGICMSGLTMTKVGKIVCEHIPIMELLPDSGLTWADFMYTESYAIIAAMETLRDNHDIPAYSMHDGLMVPVSACHTTAREIIRAFRDLDLPCRVKIERSD
jgi:hypothetical protein